MGIGGADAATRPIMVELVDAAGRTVGVAEKLAAHQPPGQPHRAFSVFLFDAAGRLLLQRRAAQKYHSPGVWSNSCCGHPLPQEPPFLAAARRTAEELGVAPSLLREAGTVSYHHPDPTSGLVEREYNHLFAGLLTDEPRPDPAEVAETVFVTPEELERRRAREPFSSWFLTVLDASRPVVREVAGAAAGW